MEIPLLCADTGPNYEQTPVNAIATEGPTNGTVTPEVSQVVPASITYTPNPGFSGTDTLTIRSFDAVTFGDRNGTVAVNVTRPGGGNNGQNPSNEFSFGKSKKNKRKGTAKLTVNVPGPGEVELSKTGKVKPATERAGSQGQVKLLVKPRGKAKAKLADERQDEGQGDRLLHA